MFVNHKHKIHIYTYIAERRSSDDNLEITKRLRPIKALSDVLYKNAKQNIIKAQTHQEKNYNRRHAVPTFKKGDVVISKNMANSHRLCGKIDSRWLGPYKYEEIIAKELH